MTMKIGFTSKSFGLMLSGVYSHDKFRFGNTTHKCSGSINNLAISLSDRIAVKRLGACELAER